VTFGSRARIGGFALAATMIVAACSSSTPTTAPSTAASAAASAAESTAASAAPSASAAASSAAINCVAGSITSAGSTALQPLIDAAAKQYQAACSGSTISVQGGGSGTGLTQVAAGTVQIGASDVTAESKLSAADAATLVNHVVARQGWIMVANPGVTGVTSLTTKQATDIWTGKVTNWKDVGGNDQAIVLVLRPASSGTRSTFKKIVLGGANEATGQALTQDSNGAVVTAVAQTPGSTSVIGFAYYQDPANKGKVTGLGLDGVTASVDNMLNNSYKLQAFGNLYTKGAPDGLTKAFLDYVMSDAVQHTLIPSLFYAPAK
jgi:phosphate transport system substrate-binding protein